MRLTDNQCDKLCKAILDLYPYEQKAALESFLSNSFNINLEYIVDSSIISIKRINSIIHKDNNQQRNEKIKILILKIPAKDLDLDKEIYEIESAIERAKKRSLLNFTTKIVYSTDDIRRKIADENPQIVHFCGHGLKNGTLKLDNDSNSGVSPEVLKSIFQGREDTIKCVLLNACHSEKATLAISQHINYVIGMNNEIIDNVAIEFAKGFYDGLGYSNDNNTYVTAFNEGIRAITAEKMSQTSIPVLKTRISYEQAIYNLLQKLDDENKIDDLIKELKSDNPKNRLLHKFLSYYECRLKEDELNKFQKIIDEIVDDSGIQNAYQKIFSDDIESDKNKIISQLVENDDKENNIPLIVEFANYLAVILKRRDNSQFEKIKGWIDDISGRLEIEIPASDENESNQKTVHTYLLIIVDDEGNSQFNLRAEYILEDENSNQSQPKSLNFPGHNQQNGITCNSFNEIPYQVKKYHSLLYDELSEIELQNIVIELFLPFQYLGINLDKDWFCFDEFGDKTPIIGECNIVTRLRERIDNNNFLKPLKLNLNRFNQKINQYDDENILKREIEIINQKIDHKNYKKVCLNFKDKKIGVILAQKGIPETSFFKAILRGAVLIAFWRRDSNSDEDSNLYGIDSDLKLELFKNNFCNLIKYMYELREKACHNDENFYPIGFLVDNPNRIPTVNNLQRKI